MLRRAARSPIVRFAAICLVLLLVIVVGTSLLAQRAAEREARNEARTINELLATSVVKPQLTRRVVAGKFGALDGFYRGVSRLLRIELGDIDRINIWNQQGQLIYSDDPQLIGQTFELDPAQRDVLTNGGTGEEDVSDASPNPTAAQPGTVRVFTQVMAKGGAPVLFEGFYSLADLEQRQHQIYGQFRWIAVGPLLVLLVLVTPILAVLTRDLRRAGIERERLLRAGLDASDAERRRIARDLHDKVVQDLAGTSFGVAALARDPSLPPAVQSRMTEANTALRDALKSLRGLLSEIHPPEIHAAGLRAALDDLVAPAQAQGIAVTLEVDGVEGADDDQASLVLRVAQEAVRNTLRHAQATTLRVSVAVHDHLLSLDVVDDGHGFDPAAPRPSEHYGLKGMASLVRDRGGRLDVRSAPGQGTTVRLEVQLDG